MNVKVLNPLLAAATALSIAVCTGCSFDGPVIKDGSNIPAMPDAAAPAEDAGASDQESGKDVEVYSNKVYHVGKDIPAGGYVVNCTAAEYSMEVVVFASAADFEAFQQADRFTVGEYLGAVEQHAWSDFYLHEGEQGYVGLQEGNVILLDEGLCEFYKYDAGASQAIYPGIYTVGTDIAAQNINIKCNSEYMQVTLFANAEQYLGYHKTSRFTVGEESDAIQAHAASTDFIHADEVTYAGLQDGMIMMIEDGAGEYSLDEGPVIK